MVMMFSLFKNFSYLQGKVQQNSYEARVQYTSELLNKKFLYIDLHFAYFIWYMNGVFFALVLGNIFLTLHII